MAIGALAGFLARDAAKAGTFVCRSLPFSRRFLCFGALRLQNFAARRISWFLVALALLLSGAGRFLASNGASLPAIALLSIAPLLLIFGLLGLARVTGAPHAVQPDEGEASEPSPPFDWALAPDAFVIGGAISALAWWLFVESAQRAATTSSTLSEAHGGFHLVAFLYLAAAALLLIGRREMHPGVQSFNGPVLKSGWTTAWVAALLGTLFLAISAFSHFLFAGRRAAIFGCLSCASLRRCLLPFRHCGKD